MRTLMTLLPLIAFSGLSANAAPAPAPTPEATPEKAPEKTPEAEKDKSATPLFKELDKDSSNGVDREEARVHPGLTDAFIQVDVNSDGSITEAEYNAFIKMNQR